MSSLEWSQRTPT